MLSVKDDGDVEEATFPKLGVPVVSVLSRLQFSVLGGLGFSVFPGGFPPPTHLHNKSGFVLS